jgi:hypothetical protein
MGVPPIANLKVKQRTGSKEPVLFCCTGALTQPAFIGEVDCETVATGSREVEKISQVERGCMERVVGLKGPALTVSKYC